MNPLVLQTLSHLLGRYGTELVNDIRRIEAFLRDLHPDSPREVAVLVEALSSGVVTRLRVLLARSGEDSVLYSDRDDLVLFLSENSGLSGRFALWAVDGWLQVLGVEAASAEVPPSPQRKRGSLVRDRPGTLESVLGRHIRGPAPPYPSNPEA